MTFNLTHGDRCGKVSEKRGCRPYFSEKMTRKKRGKCCKFLPCCSDTESEAVEDFANFEDTTLARGRVLLKRYEESHPSHRTSVRDTETDIEEINITQRSPLNVPADGILDITPELHSSSSHSDQSNGANGARGKDGYSRVRKHHSVPAEVDVVGRHVKSPRSAQPLQVDSGRVDVDVKIKKRHSVPEDKAQRASKEPTIRTPHGIQPLQIKKRHDEFDAKLKHRQSISADEVEKTIRDVIKRPGSAQKKHGSYGHNVSSTEDDLKATRNDGSEQEDVSSAKIDADAEVRRSPSSQGVKTKQASKDSSKTSLSSQESDKVIKSHSIFKDKNIQDVERNLQSPHVNESTEFSSGSDDDNVQIKKVTRDDTEAKIKKRRKPEDKAKATSDAIKQPHELQQSKVSSGINGDDTKTRRQPKINEDEIKDVSRYDITASYDFQRVQVHSEGVDRKVKKHSGPSINDERTSPPLPASEDVQMVKHDTHLPDKPVTSVVEDKKDNLDIDTEMEKHESVAKEDRGQGATSGAQMSQDISQHLETVTGKVKAEDNAVLQVDSIEVQAAAAIAGLRRPSSLPVVSVRDMQAAEDEHFVEKAAGGSPKMKKDKLRFVKSAHRENVSDTLLLMSREEEVHFLTLDTEDELEEQECKAQKRKSKIPVRVKVQEKSDSGTDHSSGSTTRLPARQNRSSTRLPVPQTKATTKHPAPPSTSNTKQPSPQSKSTTKHFACQGKSTTKQSSPTNGSATKDSAPQSKSVTKSSPSTIKQPSPPKTSTSKQPFPPKSSTSMQPAPPPGPPSGPIRKPRVRRASKAKLPDDKFKFMKKDDELPSPPDSDESILLKPANTRMKIPEQFVDENAAAQKQESSGSDTDPDFYKLIGFDLDKARALKHAADSNPLRVISTKSDVLGVFIDSSDSSLRATDGSSTDPELYKLIDLNRKNDTSDEEFNNRPSCRLDKMESSLQKPISAPCPNLMESQQPPVKITAAPKRKEVSVKRSKISSQVSSGKSSSSTEDSMSSDSRRSKAKLGHLISKKDFGLGKVPSTSKRRDISDSKLPIQLGAHPVVLSPIGSSSATPTDVHTLKGHKKATLSQAGANYQVARRLEFSPPTGSSSDLSSPSEEPDKLQHSKVPTKRAPIFSESPSSSDSFEQQIEILQGPHVPLSRPPSATELQVPSTLCISGAVSVIGYEKEIDLREREAEISTSSLPAPLPPSDLLAPSPFMRRTGQPLPPVMGKSSSSCQEPQVTPELPTHKQMKMKQDSLTLMGSKVKHPKPSKDVWFKQDETEPEDMQFTPDQRSTKESLFKHHQTDTKEVRFQLDPTTSKELRIKQHSVSKKDITVRSDSSSRKEVRFNLDPSSTRPRQDHASVNEPVVRKDTPSDLSHSTESRFRKERFDPLKKDSTFKQDPSATKEARFREDPSPNDSGIRLDPSSAKQTKFRKDSRAKDSGLGQDYSDAKEMWLRRDPQASGSGLREDSSVAKETRFRQYLPTKDSQLRQDPSSSDKARFREDPPDPAQEMWFRHDSPGTHTELRPDPVSAQEMRSRQNTPGTSSSFRQDPSTAQELRSRQNTPATSSSFRQDPSTAQEMRSRQNTSATGSNFRQDPSTAQEIGSRQDPPATGSSFRQDPSVSKHVQFKGMPVSKQVTTSNTQAPWLRRAQAEPQSADTSSQLRTNSTEVRLTRRPRVEKPSLPPPKTSQSKKGHFPHVSKH